MSKVVINYSINNKEKSIKGLKTNNRLIFNDDDSKNIIDIFEKSVILKRENIESINEMHFSKDSYCKYYLKEYDKYISINIELISLKISDNNIEIVYKIDKEKRNLRIHYEVI